MVLYPFPGIDQHYSFLALNSTRYERAFLFVQSVSNSVTFQGEVVGRYVTRKDLHGISGHRLVCSSCTVGGRQSSTELSPQPVYFFLSSCSSQLIQQDYTEFSRTYWLQPRHICLWQTSFVWHELANRPADFDDWVRLGRESMLECCKC